MHTYEVMKNAAISTTAAEPGLISLEINSISYSPLYLPLMTGVLGQQKRGNTLLSHAGFLQHLGVFINML